MQIISLIGIILVSISCNNIKSKKIATPINIPSKTNPFKIDSHIDEKIIDTLEKLDFVKKSEKYIDSFSHHKHSLSFMIDSSKNEGNDIFVRAGYNNDVRFETYYQFYVDPETLVIKVYDPVTDEKLFVKEYINLNK